MRFLFFLLVSIILIPGPIFSQDCVHYPDFIHWTASLEFYDEVRDIVISGDRAYLACDHFGMRVVDLSDPDNPIQRAGLDTDVGLQGIAVSDGHALVVNRSRWNRIPMLQVIDINNPDEPLNMGSVELPEDPWRLEIKDHHAFVACGESGLVVVDYSNPEVPLVVGGIDTPGESRDIVVAGNFAYLADGIAGLHLIDISQPEAPQIIGTFDAGQKIHAVAAADPKVVISGMTDSFLPQEFMIIDVANAACPTLVGSLTLPGWVSDIEVAGGIAFATGNPFGLMAINISNPEVPSFDGWAGSTSWTTCLGVYGEHVILAESPGIGVYHQAVPQSPPTIGHLETPGQGMDVAWADGLALVVDRTSGLSIIDMADPSNPELLALAETPTDSRCVFVSGNLALVGNAQDGLLVFDITDPADPRQLGSVATPGTPHGLTAVDSHAFIAAWDGGLQVVDVTDPASPRIAANLDLPGYTSDIEIVGDYALITKYYEYHGELLVVSIADPLQPWLVTRLDLPGLGMIFGLTVFENLAYVANGHSGLLVVDISNCMSPQVIHQMDLPGFPWDVAIFGGHAFVTNIETGLMVFDVSQPEYPLYMGGKGGLDFANSVAAGDGFLMVTDQTGLSALPFQCEQSVGVENQDPESDPAAMPPMAKLSVFPNPFNPRTTISFTLDHFQTVEIAIFDLTGKRIATLANGILPAGIYTRVWQGKNLQGTDVASGTYLLRMVTEEKISSKKVVLIR